MRVCVGRVVLGPGLRYSNLCPYHLVEKEIANCFAHCILAIISDPVCVCNRMSLILGAMNYSVICDCNILWSCSLGFNIYSLLLTRHAACRVALYFILF